jgi:hypothetical protein
MIQISCDKCGEPITIPEEGESASLRGESAVEHIWRTGHSPATHDNVPEDAGRSVPEKLRELNRLAGRSHWTN